MELRAIQASVGYGRRLVLDRMDVTLPAGEIVGILGPNGSGKSTLVKLLAGLLRPSHGEVRFDGRALHQRQVAQAVAYLPQTPGAPPGVTIRELVAYGRHPHVRGWRRFGSADRRAVRDALQACDLASMADREVATLSGGERQRAWLALALAKEGAAMLLDEPIASLDIAHQLQTLDLLEQAHRQRGVTIGIVLHDVALAARFCTRIAAVRDGRLLAKGRPEEVLRRETLSRLYGVNPDRLRELHAGTWSMT